MKDGFPQPKPKPELTNKSLATRAPSAPRQYVDRPYEQPGFIFDRNEWATMSPEHRARLLARYLTTRLKPWNAAYTKETGKLPPQPFQEPIDTDAMLEHFFAQYDAYEAEQA